MVTTSRPAGIVHGMNAETGARLFDDVDRKGAEGKPYGEPMFEYLNRIARPEAARVRDFMEHCFEQYPTGSRADVRARFRGRVDRHHLGAVAELVWHEVLRRHGCQIEPHPTLPGTSRHPEFLVVEPTGSRFYLESVVDTTRSVEEAGKEQIENNLCDRINAVVKSPNFFIGVDLRGAFPREPSIKKMASEIRTWLNTLDPDRVAAEFDATKKLPMRRFKEEEFTLTCDAIPRGRSRGQAGPGIGYIWHRSAVVRTEESVRAALRGKATRYGRLDLPYVIAVNVICDYHKRVDILDVLFGSCQTTFARTASGKIETLGSARGPDRLWGNEGDGQNNGVSAVLQASRLDAWTLANPKTSVVLVRNPWARLPYTGLLDRFTRLEPADAGMRKVAGESLADLLGLPSGWPE